MVLARSQFRYGQAPCYSGHNSPAKTPVMNLTSPPSGPQPSKIFKSESKQEQERESESRATSWRFLLPVSLYHAPHTSRHHGNQSSKSPVSHPIDPITRDLSISRQPRASQPLSINSPTLASTPMLVNLEDTNRLRSPSYPRCLVHLAIF